MNYARFGATRAMFAQGPGMNLQARGPMVSYDADDGEGGGGNTETPVEDEEGEGDTQDPPADNNDNKEPPADDKPKPSDKEAKLLKDVMKHKNAAKKASDDLAAATAALAAYGGADPEKVKSLLAAEAEAERKSLEAKGEYERILEQVRTQHAETLQVKDTELQTTRDALAAAQAQIDELTIGAAFANSTFLRDETVLTPQKARKLYGEYVDRVDGENVVYDKPRGAANRTPLVNADGDYLTFEEGIAKIVKADEDFERFQRSKLKPGAASTGTQHTPQEQEQRTDLKGVSRIAANLGALKPTGKVK